MQDMVKVVGSGKLGSPLYSTSGRAGKKLPELGLGALHDLTRCVKAIKVDARDHWAISFYTGALNCVYITNLDEGPDAAALYPSAVAVEQAMSSFKDLMDE